MSEAPNVLPEGGEVRPITRWGEDVMHRVQEPITEFDDELRRLVADMVATMYAADGVGLAACQVGVDRAVFVFDCPDESGERTVPFGPADRPMREYTGLPEIWNEEGDGDDARARAWIRKAYEHVAGLPPKAPKSRTAGR